MADNNRELYDKLLNALLCADSCFDELTKISYEYFHCPTIILDAAYNVVGQYPREKLNDEIWDSHLETQTTDLGTLSTYYRENMIEALFDANGPILVNWGIVQGYPRIASVIRDKDEILGTIGLAVDGSERADINYDDLALIIKASKIAFRFSKTTSIIDSAQDPEKDDSKYSLCSVFVSLLFQGEIAGSQELALWKERVNADKYLKPDYCILSFMQQSGDDKQKFALANIQSRLSTSTSVYCLLNDGALFVLYCGLKNHSVASVAQIRDVCRYAAQLSIPYGISEAFHELSEIDIYKYQAKRAAALFQSEGSIDQLHLYTGKKFDDLMFSGINNMPGRCYMHSAIKRIADTDRQNNSDYLHTLQAYLLALFDSKEACSALHIHRNTLNYRLNRIEEIGGFSLSDPNAVLHLLCNFYILGMDKRNQRQFLP